MSIDEPIILESEEDFLKHKEHLNRLDRSVNGTNLALHHGEPEEYPAIICTVPIYKKNLPMVEFYHVFVYEGKAEELLALVSV